MQRLAGQPLDGVILNAGILEGNRLENLDSDSLRRQFEVNALAPLRLVAALLPNAARFQAGADDQPHGLD